MVTKAGIAAALVITAFVSGRSIDLRALYDQMYPISTLKRDALDLCHQSDQTFIRAVREDREACYSGMPHAIALALGLVRPDSALAGLFNPVGRAFGTGAALADSTLASWAAGTRQPPLTPGREPAGPCRDKAAAGLTDMPADRIDTATALDVLAGHHGAVADSSLKRLGPAAGDPATALAVPGSTGTPQPSGSLTLLDTAPSADPGDALADTASTAGCAARY